MAFFVVFFFSSVILLRCSFFYCCSQRDSKGSKYCLRPQFSITIQTPIKYIASRRRKASMQTQTFRYHGEARTERYSFYYDKWKPAIFFTSIFCAFITHKSILNCVHGWDNIRQLRARELYRRQQQQQKQLQELAVTAMTWLKQCVKGRNSVCVWYHSMYICKWIKYVLYVKLKQYSWNEEVSNCANGEIFCGNRMAIKHTHKIVYKISNRPRNPLIKCHPISE